METEYIRQIGLVLSVGFFVIGIFKPMFMPLSYFTCLFLQLPYYFPVLIDLRYEVTVLVVGTARTLIGRGAMDRLFNRSNIYFLGILAAILLSYLNSWDKTRSWETTLYPFMGCLAIYLMVLCSIKDVKELKMFMWLFILIYTIMTWEPVGLFLSGKASVQDYGEIIDAKTGILETHRGMANSMNQIIPIALLMMITVKNKLFRIMAGIPLVIFISALLLNQARIGALGLIFIIILIIYYSENRAKYVMYGGAIILCLMMFSMAFASTIYRINMDAARDSPLIGFLHGVEMVRHGNIFGVGPGCYSIARGHYFSHTFAAHSLYGEIFGELGITGALAFALFALNIYKNLKKSANDFKINFGKNDFIGNLSLGILISFMLRLFVGIASHSFYIFYWYFIASLSIVVYDIASKQNSMSNKYGIN
jgi:hypothetical protein